MRNSDCEVRRRQALSLLPFWPCFLCCTQHWTTCVTVKRSW